VVKPAVAANKDLRAFAVVPIRAIKDPRLKPKTFRVLVAFCSYADRTGRTFVSLERVGADIGITAGGVSYHTRSLYKLGYMVHAKRISRQIPTKTRRIVYKHSIAEDTIRSRLSSEHLMDLAEQEHQIKANASANTRTDIEADQLRAKFSVLCERFFAESALEGWWISPDLMRQAIHQLTEQAAGCLRRDRSAI
jgi:DNA-binding MarR family transcriptional regulator